ncbi:unnamed protein product, partial [Didymodactylos carnosus]
LLLCEQEYTNNDCPQWCRLLQKIIKDYLSIGNETQLQELSSEMKLFLSTIITKKSWNYLLNLLKSNFHAEIGNEWSMSLYRLLEIQENYPLEQQQNSCLQLCDRIQFTLSANIDNNTSTIFPKLHREYDIFSRIFSSCVNDTELHRWTALIDWFQSKLVVRLEFGEIKTLLILKIYYDYYCLNQLHMLDML